MKIYFDHNQTDVILNSIADGLFTIDHDFVISYVNDAACRILGISRDEALGRCCFEVFHTNVCEHSCVLRETMESGLNVINRMIKAVLPDGREVSLAVSTALLRDRDGIVIGGVETFRDLTELEILRHEAEKDFVFEDMFSRNSLMRELFDVLPDIAESGVTVLITGESGTGKELVAQALHSLSERREGPLITVNCAALPDSLIESELFGYKAGAFTDARRDRKGRIALAEGGTLFLDEIGELPLTLQSRILRFLQEKTYEPLGSEKVFKANVRVIAATNRNLAEEVQKGKFRDDLYYRLNVMTLKLPPLRERREDIPVLVKEFIRRFNVLYQRNVEGVDDQAMIALLSHDYPGNIRELEHAIERAVVLCRQSNIEITQLPESFQSQGGEEAVLTLNQLEKQHVLEVLKLCAQNKTKAAAMLGIDKATLWRKLKVYDQD